MNTDIEFPTAIQLSNIVNRHNSKVSTTSVLDKLSRAFLVSARNKNSGIFIQIYDNGITFEVDKKLETFNVLEQFDVFEYLKGKGYKFIKKEDGVFVSWDY